MVEMVAQEKYKKVQFDREPWCFSFFLPPPLLLELYKLLSPTLQYYIALPLVRYHTARYPSAFNCHCKPLPIVGSFTSHYTMSSQYTTPSYAMPMAMPSKGSQYPTYSQYSMSPPECEDTLSSASGVPSYSNTGFSATSGSYLGGSSSGLGEYDSTTGSASGVDFQEYMQDRFASSFNPIPLDRSMAVQAQT